MRILHVIHSLDRRSGGPSNSLRGLVQAQTARSDDVAILTTTIQSAEPWAKPGDYVRGLEQEACFDGVELSIQPAYGRHRPWSRWGYSPACVRDLRERLSSPARRPEIVHIHGLFSHLTSTAARWARRADIPYVLRPAGGLDPWCLQAKRRVAKQLLLSLFVRPDVRSAAWLHAMSAAEAEVLAGWAPPGAVRCLPHGVELPAGLDAARVEFEQHHPEVRGRRAILFLGRVHAKKRPELLVEAVHSIRDQFPRAILIIAGHDDGHAAAVRRRIDELQMGADVVFTGFLTGSLKTGAYAASEVFVLPSRDENFGLGAIEAMAHGTATIVTRGVGAHAHIDQSGGGLTVNDDLSSLADGLRAVLSQNPRNIGRRGAEYVREHLTWDSIARQLDQLYRDCLPQPGQSATSGARPSQ
jgi:glycosyltransferase involved in cell wall biosynthesis